MLKPLKDDNAEPASPSNFRKFYQEGQLETGFETKFAFREEFGQQLGFEKKDQILNDSGYDKLCPANSGHVF